jgi:hypothetical protein
MSANDTQAKNPKGFQVHEIAQNNYYVVKTTVFRTGFRSCRMARFTGLKLSHNRSQKQRPE